MGVGKGEKEWRWGVVIVTLVGISGCCRAFVRESDLFPYDVPGEIQFSGGDDTVEQFDFKVPFTFFNATYNRIFISDNGQVSFIRGVRTYSPSCKPSDTPVIMPFWGDAHWDRDPIKARILYRETTDRVLLRKAARDIFRAFPDFRGITLSWMFIVTWKDIPFYGSFKLDCISTTAREKRNTFQLVLTSDGHHSFALMYYNKIEWTTGMASSGTCEGVGGLPAKAGFDYGDRATLFTIPGSCENAIGDLEETSNIDEPGKWVFRIDSNLKTADCQEFEDSTNKLRITPSVVTFGRRVPLKLEGPCLKQNYKFTCVFEDYNNNGRVEVETVGWPSLDMKSVICPMPHLSRAGRVTVRLEIIKFENDGEPDSANLLDEEYHDQDSYSSYVYLVNDDEDKDRFEIKLNHVPEDDAVLMEATWDPTFFEREVELEKEILGNYGFNVPTFGAKRRKRSLGEQPLDVIVESFDGLNWKPQGALQRGISNTGEFNGALDSTAKELINRILFTDNPELLSIHLERSKQGEGRGGFSWSKLGANIKDTLKLVMDTVTMADSCLHFRCVDHGKRKCDEWFNADRPIPLPTDTLPCPPTAELARLDDDFEQDKASMFMWFYHPGGDFSVRQKNPRESGAGSQCVYDEGGQLMIGPMGGGTLDRYSPNFDFLQHQIHDVFPYVYCCKMSGELNMENCASKYYVRRPSDNGANYSRRRVTRAVGDPHITTFDGLSYTFNGVGEFYMVSLKVPNVTFEMQARMEQYISPENVPMNASVFTAAVMQEKRGDTKITIQVSYEENRITVMLDGENIDLSEAVPQSFTVRHKSSSVTFENTTHVVVTFSSGFSFTFSTVGPNEVALNIFGMASSKLHGLSKGLLGNNDGVMENDLETPQGTQLSWNSSSESIHNDFGLKWRVPESSSIFKYSRGKSYQNYNKPLFKPAFLNEEDIQKVPQSIKDSCNDQRDCIFDFITTGSQVLASGTKEVNEMVEAAVTTLSKPITMCPSVKSPDNGFVLMTNMNVGGMLSFRCSTGYQLRNSAENCTCLENPNSIENPKWSCSSRELETVKCVKESDLNTELKCEPPPPLKNGEVGVVEGSRDYSVPGVGTEVKFKCDEGFEIYWKNCRFNGFGGICKKDCDVTYTCQVENAEEGKSIAVWQGYAGSIENVRCLSKFTGKIANFLKKQALLVHKATNGTLAPPEAKTKPYLLGC